MKYPNGAEVKVGDNVRFERGGATGTVETIIDTWSDARVSTVWWGVYSPIDVRQRRCCAGVVGLGGHATGRERSFGRGDWGSGSAVGVARPEWAVRRGARCLDRRSAQGAAVTASSLCFHVRVPGIPLSALTLIAAFSRVARDWKPVRKSGRRADGELASERLSGRPRRQCPRESLGDGKLRRDSEASSTDCGFGRMLARALG
jgi:hypothetical protein